MKNFRSLPFILVLGALLVSACGAATVTPTSAPEPAGSVKVEAMPVSFVGIIDSITGDQWVISGTTMTVDPSIVRDGPFSVGDQVKVEGHVSADGSFTVARVEAPTPQETATVPPADDNSNDALTNANTNDANSNDDNGNDANINDDNGNSNGDDHGGNTNDDNSNDDHGGNSNNDNGNGNHSGGGGDDNGGDNHGGGDNSNDD